MRRRVFIDPERKALDIIVAGSIPTGPTPLLFPLNLVAAGNDIDQRQGRQALFLSYQVRMTTVKALAEPSTTMRWMLLLDKMPDQAQVTSAAILADPVITIDSPLNLNNNKRFRVLKTGRYTVTNERPVHQFTMFRSLRMTTRYSSNSDTLATVTSNLLYWCVFTDAPSIPTAATLNFYGRLRFVG